MWSPATPVRPPVALVVTSNNEAANWPSAAAATGIMTGGTGGRVEGPGRETELLAVIYDVFVSVGPVACSNHCALLLNHLPSANHGWFLLANPSGLEAP